MLALLAAFVVSLFLGTVLFLVVLGALLLLALVLYLRFWWLRRKWARQAGQDGSHSDKPGPVTLEGEYTVHRDSDARRDD
jgi:hypothetical protein